MAELVDALASGASIRKDVEVRVLFWAPLPVVTATVTAQVVVNKYGIFGIRE